MRSESLEDVFGTKQPAEPSADNADPMAAVLSKVQDLVASARETDDESSRARHTEAREIRDRLPRFLRGGTSAELAARIPDHRLLSCAKSWRAGNAIFCGPTGCGKTTAAAYLFRRLLALGVNAGGDAWELAQRMHWFSAVDLARARRGHPLGHGDPPEVTSASSARLLFLDDAGWETDVTEVSTVLGDRYELGWPTIITTGKTPAELSAQYSAAVVRRARRSGGTREILIDCFPARGAQ